MVRKVLRTSYYCSVLAMVFASSWGTLLAQNLLSDSVRWLRIEEKINSLKANEPLVALPLSDSLIELATRTNDSTKLAEAYKYKGDLHWFSGNLPTAVKWLSQAEALADKLQNRALSVAISNNLGGVYYKAAKYDQALSNYNKAYSLGRSHLTQQQKASLSNNLGLVYRKLRQYKEAKLYLLEALELNSINRDSVGMALTYNNLGLVHQDVKEYDQAQENFHQSLKVNRSINRTKGITLALTNIAGVLIETGKYTEAKSWLYESLHLLKANPDPVRLQRLEIALGRYHIAVNAPDSAIYYLTGSLKHAPEYANVETRIEVLKYLAQAYGLANQPIEQIGALNRLVELQDSAYQAEITERIALAEVEVQNVQQAEALENLKQYAESQKAEVENREYYLVVIGIILALLLVFALVYLRRFISQRRINYELIARNAEVENQKTKIEHQHELIQLKNSELLKANDLIEHFNEELKSVNEQLEDRIKERTRALTDTYRKLSFHINNTPLAMLEWNKELELIRWPEQAQRIFNIPASAVLGKKAQEQPFMQDVQHQKFLSTLSQAKLAQARSLQNSFQQKYTNANGEVISVEWSHSVLTNELGEIESVLSIANDVSLREEAYQEAKAINQELDTFIYKASHDLRGPIARMQGVINLGKLETSEEKAHFYFGLLNQVTNEFHNLLGRLLTVHDIQQNILCIEQFNLKEFISDILKGFDQDVLARVRVLCDFAPELMVASDKNLLKIIALNLLENGFTFSSNSGAEITIKAYTTPSSDLVIKVMDNGPGIPDTLKERIFDMFYQGSTKSTGTGLGLYMVRKAARKLGGDVILSKENGLTTFVVKLPQSDILSPEQQGSTNQSAISAA